jgi:hypothetical protein
MQGISWQGVFVSTAHLRTLKVTNTFSNTSVFRRPNCCTPPNDIYIPAEMSLFRKHYTCQEKVADTRIKCTEAGAKYLSRCRCIRNGSHKHATFCICSKTWPTKCCGILKIKYNISWACVALLIRRDLLHHSILWTGSTVCYGWILFQRAGQENNLQA